MGVKKLVVMLLVVVLSSAVAKGKNVLCLIVIFYLKTCCYKMHRIVNLCMYLCNI